MRRGDASIKGVDLPSLILFGKNILQFWTMILICSYVRIDDSGSLKREDFLVPDYGQAKAGVCLGVESGPSVAIGFYCVRNALITFMSAFRMMTCKPPPK